MIGTRRRPPMLVHSIWNCYTSVIEGISLTNNCVEGWNNKFNHLVGCAHTNIWTLLNKIKDEQGFNEFKMDLLNLEWNYLNLQEFSSKTNFQNFHKLSPLSCMNKS
ncbi:hypothetical protein HZS_5320 [Henneguya salminicola]|nr:hypothetical protein HZS_5320 [Henneguya salminicola]